MKIFQNFIGGNIEYVGQNGKEIFLRQELRDTTEWWFYFRFGATAKEDGEYVFRFCNGDVIGNFGVAISRDNREFFFDPNTVISHRAFKKTFKAGETLYFAFCYPYQLADFHSFISPKLGLKNLKRIPMPDSEKGRAQHAYLFGNLDSKKTVLLTARHHACESVANYVLEGLVECLLNEKNAVTEDCKVLLVPFMDIDGVEDGDQGKSRFPHDHNRDYLQNPVYSSVRFLYDFFAKEKLVYAMDLHCPGKYGGIHDYMSLIEGGAEIAPAQQRFSDLLERNVQTEKGEISYSRAHNVLFMTEWNKPAPNSLSFFVKHKARLGFTFEIPYCGENETAYSKDGLRRFGFVMAKTLDEFHRTGEKS